jgi:hypothetical protein
MCSCSWHTALGHKRVSRLDLWLTTMNLTKQVNSHGSTKSIRCSSTQCKYARRVLHHLVSKRTNSGQYGTLKYISSNICGPQVSTTKKENLFISLVYVLESGFGSCIWLVTKQAVPLYSPIQQIGRRKNEPFLWRG